MTLLNWISDHTGTAVLACFCAVWAITNIIDSLRGRGDR